MDRKRRYLIGTLIGILSLLCEGYGEPFPGVANEESEFVDVSLHVATISRSKSLYFVDWVESDTEESVYEPKLKEFTLRTTGMSPAHEYKSLRWVRVYDREDADPAKDKPFFEAKLPGVSGTYLMIVTRGERNGERTVFFLNLNNIANDPGTLTVFNATVAKLESQVESGNQDRVLSISSGLTQGIPIGNSGTISFKFTFRGGSKQYVYGKRFSKLPNQHLILILIPPMIQGSRDLMGHWIKVSPRDLI
ncbi:MAG: hypothetical protein ACPGN3_18230 [Opitutales bacterium]